MAVTDKYVVGARAVLLTTQLNALASNGLALSAVYNNLQGGGGGDGYTLCDVELLVTFASAPTANTGCSLWFLGAQDGTNYEDGDTATTPARRPDRSIPVRPVATVQRILTQVWCPWGLFKALIKNDGTNASMAASGNTLSIRPVTVAGV